MKSSTIIAVWSIFGFGVLLTTTALEQILLRLGQPFWANAADQTGCMAWGAIGALLIARFVLGWRPRD